MQEPPPPPGFQPEAAPPRRARRGPFVPGLSSADGAPPPPPGFQPVTSTLTPSGPVHDGDTFRLSSGQNGRLFGVDAFELNQSGRDLNGRPVPLGVPARNALFPFAQPGSTVTLTGDMTYNRPVVSLSRNGNDAGSALVGSGYALPEPRYLAGNPGLLSRYVLDQRDAIANERGAYAGTYQVPSDWRHQGAANAPWTGKVPMSPAQLVHYNALLRDPRTTPATLNSWLTSQGHPAENLENTVPFMRANPQAAPNPYWQQRDVTGAPVQPAGPGFISRVARAGQEGVADTLGAPVDMVQSVLSPLQRAFGVTPPAAPWGSSANIRNGLHSIGLGQTDELSAPRSTTESYIQPVVRGLASPPNGALRLGSSLFGSDPAAPQSWHDSVYDAFGWDKSRPLGQAILGWDSRKPVADNIVGAPILNAIDNIGLKLGLIDPKTYHGRIPHNPNEVPSWNAPEPRSNWDIFRDSVTDMFSKAGTGINAYVMRAGQDDRQAELLNDEVAQGRLTRAQADQYLADQRAINASNILETRDQRALRDSADPVWRSGGFLPGNLLREGSSFAGGIVGDANPTYAIGGELIPAARLTTPIVERLAPALAPKIAPTIGRMASMGTLNAGIDAGLQGAEMHEGLQDHYDYGRTAKAFGMGALVQGGIEGVPAVARRIAGRGDGVPQRAPVVPSEGEMALPDGSVVHYSQPIKAPDGVPQWDEDGAPLVGYHNGIPNYGHAGQPGSITPNSTPRPFRPDAPNGYTTVPIPDASPVPHYDSPPATPRQLEQGQFEADNYGKMPWDDYARTYQAKFGEAPPLVVDVSGGYSAPIKAPAGVPQFDAQGAPLIEMRDVSGKPTPIYGKPGQPGSLVPKASDAAPVGNRAGNATDTADMAAEHGGASLYGPEMGGDPAPPPGFSLEQPARVPDRIDLGASASEPAPPPGFYPEAPGKPYPILSDATQAQRAAQARDIRPGDVLPLADSSVASADEAAAIGAGQYAPIRAPNEADALSSRSIPSPVDGSRTIPKRGPLDLVTWLRTQGGIKPQGGELAHYGIDNTPRKGMDFAGGENRFGKLVDPEGGMTYDEAAQRAHEAGYFPDHVERPTTAEFLDALHATHTGLQRNFLPEDYPEIDAFDAARAQRHAVEAARQDGTTLVEDRGQPVGLHDVEANTPPVHAYEEWGDQAPDFAGNVKLGNLDSPQSIKRALTVTEQRVGGFDAATRGRITHAETAALADDLGMTPQQLLARRKGQAFNAEEALAARQILAKSGNELVNMARKIAKVDNPGDELMAQFREAFTRHVAIQEQVAGMTAEAGRALQQFRQLADSRAVRGDVLKSLAQDGLGGDRLKEAADAIVENAADPAALNRAARLAAKPRFKDKLIELYYNSILSGPQTHAVNAMSNTMTAIGQIPEHAVAAVVGAPRAMLRTAGAADRVLFSELGSRVVGMLQGTKEGMRQAGRTFRTGRTPDHVNKIEGTEAAAISGLKGKIIRTPTRALSAADELYKAIARRSEIAGLAVRQAGAEGLHGPAARARAASLAANPTDDMVARSFDYARYVTFQRPLTSKFGQTLTRLSEGSFLVKLVIPFVRTPANIMKFAVERSPAAPLLSEWRADMMAGGARRDLAIAKVAVGSGAMALAMDWYTKGLITGGGPADQDAKAVMRADGWQPYSVKIGDRYYSYQRLDPYSTTLGVAADFADLQSHMSEHQKDEVAGLLLASTIKNLADKTWFSGVSDLSQAVSDSDRYGPSYIRNRLASTFVPTIVAQAAKATDPNLREARNILDAFRARIPILSRQVPARLNVWGQPIPNEGGIGPNIISPIAQSQGLNDPVNAAFLASGAHVGKPGRKVGERMLNDAEYRNYAAASGQLAHDRLSSFVTGPGFSLVPPMSRADALEGVLRTARSDTRTTLFGNYRRGKGEPLPPPGFMPEPSPPPGFVPLR
jgi:hypothetical protein